MLTRLKVSGFKNLVDVDVRFGPFTCVAGPNGVGKSNLFDAIRFLSALAEQPLMDAALSVRDEGGRTGDVRSLFHRVGKEYDDEMSFQAEMIVPTDGVDDLGQEAKARTTFLVYSLTLAYRKDNGPKSVGSLELKREDLSHIKLGEAYGHLGFPHSPAWRKSAVTGERRATPFISTDNGAGSRIIKIHQDGGSAGKPRSLLATSLPRTALSASNAAESPTATLAKREMQSWRLLQLEPSALREPDSFNAPVRLGSSGAHLAATLYHLARTEKVEDPFDWLGPEPVKNASKVYARAANRLALLIDDLRDVWIDRDERRELLTLYLTDKYGTSHPLRQVIINTHSPAVVSQVPDDSLLMAELKEMAAGPRRFSRLSFGCLSDTWRSEDKEENITSRGSLLAYLSPTILEPQEDDRLGPKSRLPKPRGKRRVVDRPDMQILLPFAEPA